MSFARKLVVNADDFGLTKAISDGIINLYQKGSISSATLMVNMPGTDHAISLALQNPMLGVGMHFNISEGRSIFGKGSSLVDENGKFFSRSTQLENLRKGKIKIADLQSELDAQYRYIANSGLNITHIDSHQHLHMSPTIFRLFAEFANERNIKIRITFPHTLKRAGFSGGWKKRLKQIILGAASCYNRKMVASRGIVTNQSFNSIFDFLPFKYPAENDYKILITKAKSNVHELMVHPYVLSNELDLIYHGDLRKVKEEFFKKAVAEYEALNSFSINDWLVNSGLNIKMVTYADF